MISSDPSPMEIDAETSPQIKDTPMTTAPLSSEDTPQLSEEEEARQAIEKLRGEDLPSKVEAAHKLDTVARTLGEERTRDVSFRVYMRFE